MTASVEMTAAFSKEDLKLLYEVSTSIHAIKDFDEMLRLVLHKIKEVFQIDGASLALHEPDRKMFYFIQTVEMQQMEGTTISRKCTFRIISASPAGFCETTERF